MTNTDKITNAAITLELFDGYTVEMCRLTLKQMADLDAYVRGKFIKNTLTAIEGLDAEAQDKIIQNVALAAQQMVWADRAATVIFETEVDGLAYYAYKYVEKSYHDDFNSWKELFNAHREENAKLFYTTRYALYFSDIHTPNAGGNNEDRNPEAIYQLVDVALKAGLSLTEIQEAFAVFLSQLLKENQPEVLEAIKETFKERQRIAPAAKSSSKKKAA